MKSLPQTYAGLFATLGLAGLAACALATGGARPAPKAHPKAPWKALVKVAAAPATVTYAHDIAPILYRNCTTCHRTGEVAPFTLASYGDARKRARQIALVTTQHVMPPWKADSHGEFQDERRNGPQKHPIIFPRKPLDKNRARVYNGLKQRPQESRCTSECKGDRRCFFLCFYLCRPHTRALGLVPASETC